jgi:glucose 1-dehydrogenase
MKLSGKRALVTGAGRGIGQAIAWRLAEEGADITIDYLNHPEEAEDTCRQVEKLGRRCLTVEADIAVVAQAQSLISESITRMGGLDILVNNAGIERNAAFVDITEADYRAVIDIDMSGAFFCSQAFARYCRDNRRGGRIVNISSVHEELPFPHFTAYCMAKGALKMMMRNLAVELAPLGITVNNIAPGAIETPINLRLLSDPKLLNPLLDNIPLHRMGKPSDVAGVAAFLASSDADYITGATIVVDGGLLWNYSEQ